MAAAPSTGTGQSVIVIDTVDHVNDHANALTSLRHGCGRQRPLDER
jgi:hypothetical protein